MPRKDPAVCFYLVTSADGRYYLARYPPPPLLLLPLDAMECPLPTWQVYHEAQQAVGRLHRAYKQRNLALTITPARILART